MCAAVAEEEAGSRERSDDKLPANATVLPPTTEGAAAACKPPLNKPT